MKRFFHIFGLTLAVLWLWHGGMSFAASPRIALVIGNSNYKIAPSLPNPANDARLMSKTLRGLGFDVIERIDADRETMLLATFELQDRLIAVGKDAVGLFYYAGHGVQVGGENYFIPLKTEIVQEREVPVKAVSASFVLKQMEFAGNRMNFVILDACRNNPFPASTRATTRGLARMNAPTGSLVAYSTGPGEVAADGVGGNSPYVLALTEAMQLPGVPAELMFKRVREQVLEATNDKQTPWEESSLKGADFYFNSPTAVLISPAPTPAILPADTAATDRLFWESIKNSDNPEMFRAYLQQYPNGNFSSLARIQLDELKAARKEAVAAALEAERKAPAVTNTVQIRAAKNWQDSGVRVRRGERYHIRATGTWSMGPFCGKTDASGSGVSFFCDRDPWNIGASGSSLVGRIGEDGVEFPVGNELELVAHGDGVLYLTAYGLIRWDNSGAVTVRITALNPQRSTSEAREAAALTPGFGSFDGEWIVEILGQRIRTNIVDKEFTVRFSTGGWRGEISGRIDATGTLTANGIARKSLGNLEEILSYSAEFSGASFLAASTRSGRKFKIRMTPVSP